MVQYLFAQKWEVPLSIQPQKSESVVNNESRVLGGDFTYRSVQ